MVHLSFSAVHKPPSGRARIRRQPLVPCVLLLTPRCTLAHVYLPSLGRMLSLTGDLLGPDAELIVQQLLLHGRSQLPGLAASIRQAGSDMSDERLVECFKLLLAHRLVRRVLPPMPEDSNDAAGASLFDSSLQYDPFTEHNVDFSTVPRSHPAVVTPKRKRSASADAGSTAGKRRKLAAPGGLEGGDDGDNGAVAPKLGSAGSDLPEWVPNYGQFTRSVVRSARVST